MTSIQAITYQSSNAPVNMTWPAYVVLPNGKPWMVFGYGATEDEARNEIIALYEVEAVKVKSDDGQHHLAGKIWMVHPETKDKKRVDPSGQHALEWLGYKRGRPRS